MKRVRALISPGNWEDESLIEAGLGVAPNGSAISAFAAAPGALPSRSGPEFWRRVATAWLPFADAASVDLPLARLLRLSLFQVSVGMTVVLLNGTLNRVMIVELGVPAWLVALMIALPLVFAPLRALIGHRSDHHRSILGWRRVPYIWFGTLLQFGGLALLPFALLLMSRPDVATAGTIAALLAFLMTGAGLHTAQTAGLALATDLAPEDTRPRAVALLYVMLLVGMVASAFLVGAILKDFTPTRLIQVVQGVGLLTMIFNLIALWKQEPRRAAVRVLAEPRPSFREAWAGFTADADTRRLLVTVGLGAAAFSMQDVLLEPYGGEILGISVGGTTELTGLWALGNLFGFAYAARQLSAGGDPHRIAGLGGVIGIFAFLAVLFAAPVGAPALLYLGAALIGLGAGLFMVGTLTAAMALARGGHSGIALGAWGAVQATAAGLAIAIGGIARDLIAGAAVSGDLGVTLAYRATGYGAVYVFEIVLLFATLIALGPLAGRGRDAPTPVRFGLSQFPT